MTPLRRSLLGISTFLLASPVLAGPILPPSHYIPDGEPRVFGDRVYLYGSHDRAHSKRFCDYLLKVYSAPLSDLTQWRDEGISFATRDQPGHKDDVPWSDNELYAPDVVEKDGKYYLFAYIVGAPAAVAVSDSPAGPFKLISQITPPPGAPRDFANWGQYADPGVLVDTDGKVYLYWGYKRSAMARLDPANMTHILAGTHQTDIIPADKPFNFFEAISPRKIGNTYYIIYADGGILTYATSPSPTGPFKYGGHIIGNGHQFPGGNNHGSLAQINGQWYIFYHRMTNNTIFSRIACVEKVNIEPDGSIKQVEMTSLGFRDHLDPTVETPAYIACVLTGGNYISESRPGEMPVINNQSGSVIGFKYFHFPAASSTTTTPGPTFTATVKPGTAPGTLEIWQGPPDKGTKLGELSLPSASATSTPSADWQPLSTPISPPTPGRHPIYLRFSSPTLKASLSDIKSFHLTLP